MSKGISRISRLGRSRLSVTTALVAAATSLAAPNAASALTIVPTTDAFALANTLFLNSGGLAIQSAAFLGQLGQGGTYTNATGTYGLPVNGIVLSSGNVSEYATGPNTASNNTTAFGTSASPSQEALLDPITGGTFTHFDVSQLDISFFAPANVDSVTFFGAFGSEEFPEFVGSNFIDGFGLYVNGTNVAGAVPTGGTVPQALNINHPDFQAISGTELDGLVAPNGNPVLRFDVPVTPGAINDFQIIIADASDLSFDSTVYLSSFFATSGNGGDGSSEFDPLLPSNPPDPLTGEFIIEVPQVPAGQVVWIDPPVAVGYEYEIVDGIGAFASIIAPSLASVADLDGYFVTVGGVTVSLAAGQVIDFLTVFGLNPTAFTLSGIDLSLLLDPTDPSAFPLGVSFTQGEAFSVSMTPLTEDVSTAIPLPGGLALYLGALALAGCFARGRRFA